MEEAYTQETVHVRVYKTCSTDHKEDISFVDQFSNISKKFSIFQISMQGGYKEVFNLFYLCKTVSVHVTYTLLTPSILRTSLLPCGRRVNTPTVFLRVVRGEKKGVPMAARLQARDYAGLLINLYRDAGRKRCHYS